MAWSDRTLPLPARFVCKNNGVLFENQLLQIGLKSEFRQNLGMYLITQRELQVRATVRAQLLPVGAALRKAKPRVQVRRRPCGFGSATKSVWLFP